MTLRIEEGIRRLVQGSLQVVCGRRQLHALCVGADRPSATTPCTNKLFSLSSTAGVHYRKSCASSGACLISSSGYQQFCTGKINSVCISCCNTALCNGPRPRKRAPPSAAAALDHSGPLVLSVLLLLLLLGHAALC